MHKLPIIAILSILCCQGLAADPVDAEKVESSGRAWLEAEDRLRDEQNQWVREQELLTQELGLLQQEIDALRDAVEQAKSSQAPVREVEAEIAGQKEKIQQILGRLDQTIAPLLPALQQAYKRLPPRLQKEHLGIWEGLQESDPLKRFYAALSAQATMETARGQLHLDRETHDGNLLDVLYIGLDIAFGCSPDGDVAGRAVWDGSKWIWEWEAAWAGRIRNALKTYQGKTHADFSDLPFPEVP